MNRSANNLTLCEDPHDFLVMQNLYDAAVRQLTLKFNILNSEFNVLYARNPIHHIDGRVKSQSSIVAKLIKRGLPLSIESARKNINDIAGVRSINDAEMRTFLILLNPFAPHITEELWQTAGFEGRLYQAAWPEFEEEKTVESVVEIGVQVNGKMRVTINVSKDETRENVIAMAKEALGDKLTGNIVKEIYVPGRIVNIVVK